MHSKAMEIAEKWQHARGALSERTVCNALAADIDAAIAEALEKAAEAAEEHSCNTWPECCNCGGFIAAEIRALISTPKDGAA